MVLGTARVGEAATMANEPDTQRISADLRQQIGDGRLGPGAPLPSEDELARDYNVSRETARSVLEALERERLVIVQPREGRVVRGQHRLRWHLSEFEQSDHTVLRASDAWKSDIQRQGHDPGRQDLEVDRIAPPVNVAARLHLDPRTDIAVVRRHLRYIDGKPAIISDEYFDERLVEGTELAEEKDTEPRKILAARGYEQAYDIDEIITRTPTPAEVDWLGISAAAPVAEHIRTGYTAENRPVRVVVSIIPEGTLILEYTIPA
jgi:DNA-binding GntR family transcriptional regulator